MELIEDCLYIKNGFEAKLCEVAAQAALPETKPLIRIDRCPGEVVALDEHSSELVLRGLANISLAGHEQHGIEPWETDKTIDNLFGKAQNYFPRPWEFEVY